MLMQGTCKDCTNHQWYSEVKTLIFLDVGFNILKWPEPSKICLYQTRTEGWFEGPFLMGRFFIFQSGLHGYFITGKLIITRGLYKNYCNTYGSRLLV